MTLPVGPQAERIRAQSPRPPEAPYGRVFRVDVSPPGDRAGKRMAYADGVIAPDGAALARIRDTGVTVTSPRGVEDLVAALGDPRLRIVYRNENNEL